MKFENTAVFNFEGAFHGMRAPKESWDKSDSKYDDNNNYIIGENDLKLAQTLIFAGPEHSKFLRQIFVSVNITAPLYWYKEFDTYKIGTTANSTSTMHKLTSKPITIDCFETDDFDPNLEIIPYKLKCDEETGAILGVELGYDVKKMANNIIENMERLRQKYLETKDVRYWKELIRWLPESWLQTRTWTANYAVLRNIYFQRKDHKLSEWHQFCKWIESLPYAKELITITKGENNE